MNAMSHGGEAIPLRLRVAARLRNTTPATLWGGLLLSLLFHAAIVAILVWQLRPRDVAGRKSDSFHTIGVVVKSPSKQDAKDTGNSPVDSVERQPFSNKASATANRNEVPKKPPVNIEQPNPGRKVIGPGGLKSPINPDRGDPGIVLPSKIGAPPPKASSAAGNGQAAFFDIDVDGGQRIVYVLDRSFSMKGLPLQFAKQKLVASLNGLSPKQRFQVVFFNEAPHAIVIRRGADPLTSASQSIVQQAKLRISGVNHGGSTNHLLALQAALDKSRKPDVVFFLSDTDSQLAVADLHAIKKMNASGARIHCIEFGRGEDLSGTKNFLKHLAAMNRGKYVYVDVKKLRRR